MMNKTLALSAFTGLILMTTPIWSNDVVNPQTDKVAVVPKTDEQITKAIKDEINSDKDFATDAAKVEIKTEKGKVILSGVVEDQDTKADVESVAKDIAGDSNVVNNIVVKAAA
jgi:hypothetical protein